MRKGEDKEKRREDESESGKDEEDGKCRRK